MMVPAVSITMTATTKPLMIKVSIVLGSAPVRVTMAYAEPAAAIDTVPASNFSFQNHDAVDPALEELKRARSAQLIQERSRSILERNQTANTQFGPAILNWLLRGGDILGDNRSWFGARRVERNGLPVSFGSVFHTR
jgi:hypothetical protein